MKFVNPAILWALPLGLVPIIIYYLMRYRSLKVGWGANYVLERALERLRKKLYLDQIILLALRVAACLLLVVAFARPSAKGSAATVQGTSRHRVIVADASYSMLAGEPGATRWDRARDAMKRLVSTWSRGEKWSLLRMGDGYEWVVDGAFVESPEKSAALVDAMKPGSGAASLAKALEMVRGKVGAEDAEVYVFADDQATAWAGMEAVGWGARDVPPIYWLDPPLSDRTNLAVTAVRPASDLCLVSHPRRVFVAVRNFGTEPVRDAPVELLVDGTFRGRERVSLLPDQESWLHMDVTLDAPGPHHVMARLGKDALEFDNRMSAGLEAAREISVLVLRDSDKAGKFDSAWEFLQIAGRVQHMVENDEPIFRMGPLRLTLCEGALTEKELGGADVVLLDGARTITEDLAARLKEWMGRGGGLVLAADDTVDAKVWNELLGGAGLLPARLARLRVETLGGDRFASIGRSEFAEAALRGFETDEDGDLGNARFYAWWQLEGVPEGTRVLAEFTGTEPFIVEKRMDPGRVLLLAGGLSGRGNNLVVREFYLPLLFQVFSEAASGTVYPRAVAQGEPVRLRLRGTEDLRAVAFSNAAGDTVPLTPVQRGGEAVVTVPQDATRCLPEGGLCSILLVRADGTERVWFGVQGARVDSDLRPIDPELKRQVVERLRIVEASSWEQLDEILKAGRRGNEWHHWVVIGLLAALFGEMLMQRRFL